MMSIRDLWNFWQIKEKVNTMDQKALLKLAVCALMTAVATGGTEYMATDHVSWMTLMSSVGAALVSYLKDPPHK